MIKVRLDVALVERELVHSREKAKAFVKGGFVEVNGMIRTKAAMEVTDDDEIELLTSENHYVSRGAFKLIGALNAFTEISVKDKYCLDVGASTGGFTQVLCERGARKVIALDVGYNQLAKELQNNPRVISIDRLHVNTVKPDDFPFRPEFVVVDVSFISLVKVSTKIFSLAKPDANFLFMVKPQFEVGKDNVGAGGVVRDPKLHEQAITGVIEQVNDDGFGVRGIAPSQIAGAQGNLEYFLWIQRGSHTLPEQTIISAIGQL